MLKELRQLEIIPTLIGIIFAKLEQMVVNYTLKNRSNRCAVLSTTTPKQSYRYKFYIICCS